MRGAGPLENLGKQPLQAFVAALFEGSFRVEAVKTPFQAGAMASAPFSSVFPDCRRRKASSAQSCLFVPARLYFVSH